MTDCKSRRLQPSGLTQRLLLPSFIEIHWHWRQPHVSEEQGPLLVKFYDKSLLSTKVTTIQQLGVSKVRNNILLSWAPRWVRSNKCNTKLWNQQILPKGGDTKRRNFKNTLNKDIHKAQTCTTGTNCVRPVQAACWLIFWISWNAKSRFLDLKKEGNLKR